MADKNLKKDELLTDGLRKGDIDSFETIYRKYVRELYFISVGYLGNEYEAQDIVQEAFIYLWNNRSTARYEKSVKAYLYRSVKHASLNLIRNRRVREKFRNKNHNDDERLITDAEEKSVKEFEEISNDYETKIKHIKDRLSLLPENCKRVFMMSVIEGMSYKEVSGIMGISINTVKTQIKIAYKKIRANCFLLLH
jgi:RNA polymerase sigma-70 factor (ECF subfamily)